MNVADWIDRHADFTPDKMALRYGEGGYSYAGLAVAVARLAGVLQKRLRVRAGDRVAYVGYNSPEMLILLLACARVGAIFLPLNWRLAAPEHRAIVNDCEPVVLFAREEFVARVEENRGRIACRSLVTYGQPAQGWLGYADLLEDAVALRGRDSQAGYDAPLLLCYTSGTTGLPKGALLSQNALLHAAINSAHMHDLTSEDRVLTSLPLFHVGGLNIQTLPALHAGATVTLQATFDPLATLAAIAEQAITLTVLVPAQLVAILATPQWQTTDLSSLRVISTGSTLVPASLIAAVHARGVPLIQVYGATETSPIATYLTRSDAQRKPGSAGKAALHCEMRIVDEQDREVARGASGEILIRGPNVMTGYWNQPEATAACLRNGWYYTGDVGHLDAEGYLYVDDRKKEMIISGGENIYPAELENLLAGHEAIVEAAVVGRPDAKWGEIPVAVVVLKNGHTLDREALASFFEGKLARFKHPRDLICVDALPRNPLGKIQKQILREMVAASAAGAAAG
ncbi:MAG: long-chain fatty acid--CoA ligase [Proteobacteria bacterium]|nr:MAG: long-chain fatty acid--CoA ligase [Pseudomonadota bacterium]QKK11762.1 MAG: long-chain fatty acid--CoA ligase [Pseudomonadota bacterium]